MAESISYNMDCMEYMRSLPDDAFELAEERFAKHSAQIGFTL